MDCYLAPWIEHEETEEWKQSSYICPYNSLLIDICVVFIPFSLFCKEIRATDVLFYRMRCKCKIR